MAANRCPRARVVPSTWQFNAPLPPARATVTATTTAAASARAPQLKRFLELQPSMPQY
jgi:hypothetical protein